MNSDQHLLIRHHRIAIPQSRNSASAEAIGTLIANLAYYGYCPSAEAFDRFIVFRVLVGKLITWKTEHLKPLIFVFLIQLFQTLKLWRKPTFTGRVNN